MKKEFTNLKILMWLILTGLAGAITAQSESLTKVVTKTFYQVPVKGKLDITGDFAKIHVTTNDGDSISVKITVEVKSDDRQTAQKYFDGLQYSIFRGGDVFYIENEQNFPHEKYFYVGFFKNRYVEYESVYEVVMPRQYDLNIEADYSVLKINELDGSLNADMDYGRILAGHLKNAHNRIEGDYMTENQIEMIRSGEISSDFSDFRIDLSFYLKIDSDYSKFYLEHAKTVIFQGDFSTIKADRIKSLYVDADYARIHLKRLYRLKMKGDFNHLLLERLPSTAQFFDIEGDYGEFTFRNPDKVPFVYDLTADHSRVFIKNKKTVDGRHGYYLDKDANIRFKVDMDFGKLIIE